MWEISPRINSPKNDDPLLLEPIRSKPAQPTIEALEFSPDQGPIGRPGFADRADRNFKPSACFRPPRQLQRRAGRRVPRKIARSWLEQNYLLPLDGLGEVETNLAAGLRGCGQHVY
jgi:hypothetical protein